MAGKFWDGLTTGAQSVAAKAGAIFGGLKQSLFGDTPELAITPPGSMPGMRWPQEPSLSATGSLPPYRPCPALSVRSLPTPVPRGKPSGRGFPAARARRHSGDQGSQRRDRQQFALLRSRHAGNPDSRFPQVAEQKQPLGAAQPAESIGQRIIENVLSLVPRLDERLVPKALSAMLMLQPVMASAAPPPQPMNGTVQTVAAAVEPVSKSYIQPFAMEPALEKGDASLAPAGIDLPITAAPTPIAKPPAIGTRRDGALRTVDRSGSHRSIDTHARRGSWSGSA